MAQQLPQGGETGGGQTVPGGVATPPTKKGGFLRTFVIVGIIVLILGATLYAWLSVKHPEALGGNETGNFTGLPPENTEQQNNYKTLFFIVGGGLLLTIGYLIWNGIKNARKPLETKIPVPPDRAIDLFIENFCKHYNIESMWDGRKGKDVYVPANRRAITVNDRLPYYHTATGDNFLLVEIEVREGEMQGLHTVVIPIDRGEKVIQDGYYRVDTHTPRFQFQLNRVNYPMSSMQDKRERMQMALMETLDSDRQEELLAAQQEEAVKAQSRVISTPVDQYAAGGYGGLGGAPMGYGGGGYGGGYQPRRRPYYRRPYYPRRRY